MRENILLMFLSPVKVNGGKISETHYKNLEGEKTHTTNESAVRYLLQNNSADEKISKIFILASKAVRENIENFSEKITHLDYFKNRMKKFFPNIENYITKETIYNYDEDNDGEKNLKSVAEMARKIQNFAAKSENEIILHADLTGGMRHINMMMLDIIRLLEYSGVKIGKIIYSNYNQQEKVGTVEEVKNIYDLFQLISGVEEFINFGSVKVLNDYYKNHSEKISDSLNILLKKMENFAEAIKLCRYGQFKTTIEKLHDAINNFSPDKNNLNDILMARLIERIKHEYKMLIATRGQDDLKIIRWCIEKGYLQQALTLYTERVPEYIAENNFYKIPPQEYKKLQEKTAGDKRNEGFYFLNNYLADDGIKKDDKNKTEIQKEYEKRVADLKNFQIEIDKYVRKINNNFFEQIKKFVIPAIRNKNFSYDDWRKKIFANIKLPVDWVFPEGIFTGEEKLCEQLNLLVRLKNSPQILLDLDNAELNLIRPIIKKLSGDFEKNPKGFQRMKKILEFVETSNADTLKKYFPAFECKTQIFRLQYMLEKKIFTLNIDRKIFLRIMNRYFRLKDERNHSNHARNDIGEFETAADLEKCMLDGLEEIEKVVEG